MHEVVQKRKMEVFSKLEAKYKNFASPAKYTDGNRGLVVYIHRQSVFRRDAGDLCNIVGL